MSTYERQIAPLYERWRRDIFAFASEGMNFRYTWQQAELMQIVQDESVMTVSRRKKRIAVRSGQGPGKTAVSVIIALWRVLRYEGSLVVVTSPSMRQCKQWVDEAKRLLKEAHPLIAKIVECYGTKIQINKSSEWEIRTATATKPENLQGIHEKHLTFIADEASGVSNGIFETIKGTLSNPDALFLAIGNPNTTSCTFHECFTSHREMWHCLAFNAEDTARDYPHIVSPDRNKQIAWEYGRDSDVYRVRVLGEFPLQDPNTVMSISDIDACTKTSLVGCASIDEMYEFNQAFGIDLARFGSDESVIVRRQGLAVADMEIFIKKEPTEVVERSITMQLDNGWEVPDTWFIPDAGGMGQGVLGTYHKHAPDRVLEFHTQGRPYDKKFYDIYSEAWFHLRDLVRERIVHLPHDPRLLKQLSTRQYYMKEKRGKSKIKVETKDEWRDRLEITESPDRADAVIMAFYPHLFGETRSVRRKPQDHKVGTAVKRRRKR